jgi:hypothetical protein
VYGEGRRRENEDWLLGLPSGNPALDGAFL